MFKTTVTLRDGLSYDYIGEDINTELVEGVYIIRDYDNNTEIGYPVSYILALVL